MKTAVAEWIRPARALVSAPGLGSSNAAHRVLQEITGIPIRFEQGFDGSPQPQVVTAGLPEEGVPLPRRALEGLLEKPRHVLPS